MKERTVAASLVLLLVIAGLMGAKSADAIFVAIAAFFFAICIAYAEGCGRL